MHYAGQYRETLKKFLFCLNAPLLAKLLTVTNQPVPRLQQLPLHFVSQNIFSFQLVENIDGYQSG